MVNKNARNCEKLVLLVPALTPVSSVQFFAADVKYLRFH
jgi:hypothetical protein